MHAARDITVIQESNEQMESDSGICVDIAKPLNFGFLFCSFLLHFTYKLYYYDNINMVWTRMKQVHSDGLVSSSLVLQINDTN